MNEKVSLLNVRGGQKVLTNTPEIIIAKTPTAESLMPLNQKDSPATIRAMLAEWLRTSADRFHTQQNRFLPESVTDGKLTISQKVISGKTHYVINHAGKTVVLNALPGDSTSGKLWQFYRQIASGKPQQGYESLFNRAAQELANARQYGTDAELSKTAVKSFQMVLGQNPESISMYLTPPNEITRISWKDGKFLARETLPKLENMYEKLIGLIETSIIKAENLITGDVFSRLNLSKTKKSVSFPDGSKLFVGEYQGKPVVGVTYNMFGKKIMEFVKTGHGGVFDNLRIEADELFKKIAKIAPKLRVITRK